MLSKMITLPVQKLTDSLHLPRGDLTFPLHWACPKARGPVTSLISKNLTVTHPSRQTRRISAENLQKLQTLSLQDPLPFQTWQVCGADVGTGGGTGPRFPPVLPVKEQYVCQPYGPCWLLGIELHMKTSGRHLAIVRTHAQTRTRTHTLRYVRTRCGSSLEAKSLRMRQRRAGIQAWGAVCGFSRPLRERCWLLEGRRGSCGDISVEGRHLASHRSSQVSCSPWSTRIPLHSHGSHGLRGLCYLL